jgi:2-dehydropantoate 2-reductase
VRTASRAARDKPSSLLQDLARGRRTEIDALNGRIAALGEEMGIACPVNRALTLLVKAAESVRGAALASSRRMDSPSLALYDARAGEEALSRT